MNSTAKCVISFIVGGVIGALGTWLGVKKFYEKRQNKIVDEIREYYISNESKIRDEMRKSAPPMEQKPQKDPPEAPRIPSKPPVEKADIVEYNRIVSRYDAPKPPVEELLRMLSEDQKDPEDYEVPTLVDEEFYDPDADDLEDDGEDMHPEDVDKKFSFDDIKPLPEIPDEDPEPYLISAEQFLINDGMQQKDTLWYHINDNVLLDEQDHFVSLETVGYDNLQLLLEQDTIFVRNFVCGLDFEVIKTEAPISDLMKDEALWE